jgi:hypothetical protein
MVRAASQSLALPAPYRGSEGRAALRLRAHQEVVMPGEPRVHSPSCPAGTRRRPVRRAARAGLRRAMAVSAAAAAGFATLTAAAVAPAGAAPEPFLSHFHTVTNLGTTVPSNGDVNPYGVTQVPATEGKLVEGDTLVSNFNASSNLQGTGSTIVEMSPSGVQTLFAQIDANSLNNLPGGPCPGGVGLTTALTVISDDFVIVGSLPVTNMGNGSPEAGCLIVLDNQGVPVETFSGDGINGPWDLTASHFGFVDELFVTNVLNNTVLANPTPDGTVLRLDLFSFGERMPILVGSRVIGTGFGEQLNTSALVIGPTGDALGANGTLYVADSLNNRIQAIPDASTRRSPPANGSGSTLTSGGSLSDPLGMTLAPNGDIVTVNGGNPNAVETTPFGNQIDTVQFDPLASGVNGGDLFGVTIPRHGHSVLFVDDGDNTLKRFGTP